MNIDKLSDDQILELLKYVRYRKDEISTLIDEKVKQGEFNKIPLSQWNSSITDPFFNNKQTIGCIIACHEFLSSFENDINSE